MRRGTMTNISEAGAALLTPVPLPRNSVVDPLRFSFPSDTNDSVKVSVTAGVVKTEKQRFADSTERYRSGLVFLNLTGEPLKKISKLIDRSLGQSGRGSGERSERL